RRGVPAIAVSLGVDLVHTNLLVEYTQPADVDPSGGPDAAIYGLPLTATRALSVALDTLCRGDDITGMRRLMLLRHAKTERADPGDRDRDRKLMKPGRSDASMIGVYMARHGLVPDLALVSPATRAQETWRLAAAAFPQAPPMLNNDR